MVGSSKVVSDIRRDIDKDMKAEIKTVGCGGGAPCGGVVADIQGDTVAEKQEAQVIPTVPVKKKKKVAIVGCADSKDAAPFGDKSFEIWGVNNLFYHIPRWNRWFEIHTITKDANGKFMRRWAYDFRGQPVKQYLNDIAKMPVPVIMQQTWPEIPNSRAYPLKEIVNAYGRYFTNTISYQLALAIYEGYEVIHCYGVDMAVGCLSPDTRVLTADLKWVPSSSLKVGDELMAFDEHYSSGPNKTRRWRKTKVTACPEIERPCYRVYLEDGTSMIASERHGWLTHGENINRWKTTAELVTHAHRKGRPTRVLKLTDTWNKLQSWESGYLAAAFDGEGHLSQTARKDHIGSNHMSLGFAQKKNGMQDEVINALSRYGFDICKQDYDDASKMSIKGGKAEVMRFLGTFRPPRLMDKFNADVVGELQSIDHVAVGETEFIGMHPVVGLETEAKTYVAEGIASHNSEYSHQRASCEYFLGIIKGLGRELYIPPTADLLKTRFLYAFEEKEIDDWMRKVNKMRQSMFQRMTDQKAVYDKAEKKIQQYIGAIEATNEIDKIWSEVRETQPMAMRSKE